MSESSPQRSDTICVAVCFIIFDYVYRGCGRTINDVAHCIFMTEREKTTI